MRMRASAKDQEHASRHDSVRHAAQDSWIRPYMKRYGALLAAAIAISALSFAFAAGLMFTSGYMISLAAALPLTVLVLHLPSIFVRIFGIGKPLLSYAERLMSHNWILRMTSEMRQRLYEALERKSYALRSAQKLGGILSLLTEDIGHIQDLFLRSVIPLAVSWLIAIALIACTGAFSVQLAMLFAIVMLVILIAMPMLSVAANGARLDAIADIKAELYDKIADNVEGLSDWVLSGNLIGYRESTAALRRERRTVDAKIRRYGRWHDLIAQVFFGICITALALWACIVFAAPSADFAALPTDAGISLSTGLAEALGSLGSENSPAYAPNWIAAFVLCIFPLLEAIAPASHAALELKERRGALERIDDFLGSQAEQTANPTGHTNRRAGSAEQTDQTGRTSQTNRTGKADRIRGEGSMEYPRIADSAPCIELDGVGFSYEESSEEVLRSVDLRIPHGEHVAVLGRSGIGKTTLAALIHGDYAPSCGKCTVGEADPANPSADASSIVGVISQKPYIFNLTLRDNLKLADPHATEKQLVEAIRAVGLYGRFQKLPHGLDSVIESRAQNFSGGEAQRIAVARILLAKQPIVVLDEPFAGLDQRTETALLETILRVLKDRTIIVITHHLENIDLFDKVIFMQGPEAAAGSIAFCGTPEELARDARYGRLLQLSNDKH